MNIIRQGDVLLVQVAKLPPKAKDVTPQDDVILAYGEVTGHAHRIAQTIAAPKVRVWDAAGERYVQALEAEALLGHEEHTAVSLAPGTIWRQVHQVEERGEEVRRVAD